MEEGEDSAGTSGPKLHVNPLPIYIRFQHITMDANPSFSMKSGFYAHRKSKKRQKQAQRESKLLGVRLEHALATCWPKEGWSHCASQPQGNTCSCTHPSELVRENNSFRSALGPGGEYVFVICYVVLRVWAKHSNLARIPLYLCVFPVF